MPMARPRRAGGWEPGVHQRHTHRERGATDPEEEVADDQPHERRSGKSHEQHGNDGQRADRREHDACPDAVGERSDRDASERSHHHRHSHHQRLLERREPQFVAVGRAQKLTRNPTVASTSMRVAGPARAFDGATVSNRCEGRLGRTLHVPRPGAPPSGPPVSGYGGLVPAPGVFHDPTVVGLGGHRAGRNRGGWVGRAAVAARGCRGRTTAVDVVTSTCSPASRSASRPTWARVHRHQVGLLA